MLGGHPDDQVAVTHREPARRNDQPAIRGARERGDGALEIGRIVQINWAAWKALKAPLTRFA